MPNLTKLAVAASLTFGIAGTTFGLITVTGHDAAQPALLPQAADPAANSPTGQDTTTPANIKSTPQSSTPAAVQTSTDTTPLTAVVHALDTAIQQTFEERAAAQTRESEQVREMAEAWNAGQYQAWEAAQQQWWQARNTAARLTRTLTWLITERKSIHVAWKADSIINADRTLVPEDGDFWCDRPNPVTDQWNETRQACDRQGATANLAYREWLTALSTELDHRLAASVRDPADTVDSLVRNTFTELAQKEAAQHAAAGTKQAAAYGLWQNLNGQIQQYNSQRPTP